MACYRLGLARLRWPSLAATLLLLLSGAGAVGIAWAAPATQPPDNGGQVYNVKAFGAAGDGVTDDTSAIAAADQAARDGGRGLVWFPAGTYLFSSPLTAKVTWAGSGMAATTLVLTRPLVAGVAAISTPNNAGEARAVALRDLSVRGPGTPVLGKKTANADGISVNQQFRLERVRVENFDSGIVLNSLSGHMGLHNITSTNNYYGVYIKADGGDNFISDSFLDGNSFAGIGTPARNIVNGLRLDRTRIGSSPYGLYQEDIPSSLLSPPRSPQRVAATDWLGTARLTDVSFENIGNGAIFTELHVVPGRYGGSVANIMIDSPRFSWNDAYRIPSRSKDYAITLGFVFDFMHIQEPTTAFTDGDRGTLFVQDQQASWEWLRDGAAPPTIVIGAGKDSTFQFVSTRAEHRRGTGVIAAGTNSVRLTIPSGAPKASVFPIVQATSDGGQAEAATLLVSVIDSGPTIGTVIEVSLAEGATAPADVTFTWRLL